MSVENQNQETEVQSVDAIMARLAELEAENARLKAPTPVTLKVSEKGAVSVYGIRKRFPVTLYANQMERLLGEAENIRQFMRDNAGELSTLKS